MSVQFYYVMHLTGILPVFTAYGLLIARSMLGSSEPAPRKLGAIASGVGLVLILISGFALLAKLGFGWPLWSFIKMGVWLLLGGLIVGVNRAPQLSRIWFWVVITLGFVAVFSVYLKPGA